jgi:acyl carrier protein
LRKVIAEKILFSDNGYPYPDDTSFLENGIVDSMNVMEIVFYTEEAFGVSIEDGYIVRANFDSVKNISNFMRRKTGQTA